MAAGTINKRRTRFGYFRNLHLEHLEARCVLSASPSNYDQVTPDWFATLGTSSGTTDRWIVRLTAEAVARAPTVSAAAELLQSSAIPVQVLRGLGLPGQLLVTGSTSASA